MKRHPALAPFACILFALLFLTGPAGARADETETPNDKIRKGATDLGQEFESNIEKSADFFQTNVRQATGQEEVGHTERQKAAEEKRAKRKGKKKPAR